MKDVEIVEFFEKLIKRFYDEDKNFKKYFDDSCQEYIGWNAPYRIPGFEAGFETGSERVCFKFRGDFCEDLCNNYVVKLGLRWKEGECDQCRHEMEAYGKFKEIGYEDLVTRIIEGHRIADVLGLCESSDARFYIVERADVYGCDYEDALYYFVKDHEDMFLEDFDHLASRYGDRERNTYEELSVEEKNTLILDFCNDSGYSSCDELCWLLKQDGYDCRWGSPLRDLLSSIGDFHSENIALTPNGWKVVDYGWSTTFGSRSYDD